jgi:hypothetical protein
MKGLLLLVLGAAAVVGFGFVSTGDTLLKLGIKPGNIRRVVLHLLNSKIYFDLILENHTQKTLKLQQITADVTIAGEYIGNFDIRKEVIIGPGKTGTMTNIPISVSNFSALSTILTLIQDRGEYKEMTVTGKVKGNGFLYPFEETTEFKVPQEKIDSQPKF